MKKTDKVLVFLGVVLIILGLSTFFLMAVKCPAILLSIRPLIQVLLILEISFGVFLLKKSNVKFMPEEA